MTSATLPAHIGSVVRLAGSPVLGIIKAVHAGTTLFPGWHYDIAWTGRETLDRAVPDHSVVVVSGRN